MAVEPRLGTPQKGERANPSTLPPPLASIRSRNILGPKIISLASRRNSNRHSSWHHIICTLVCRAFLGTPWLSNTSFGHAPSGNLGIIFQLVWRQVALTHSLPMKLMTSSKKVPALRDPGPRLRLQPSNRLPVYDRRR
jgi:hypothetical protein